MPIITQLDLNVEVDVLTAGTTAEVVNAILESLLYQRNQIPFVYKTYRYYVNKWLEQDGEQLNTDSHDTAISSFKVQRKKQLATNTKRSISAMREIIRNTFEKKRIKSIRFLFGSTTFTPKESYTIHIPTHNISLNHLYDHHRISQAKINQTLLSLLTNEDLYGIFSHNLSPTNIYLELEILESHDCLLSSGKSKEDSHMFPKDMSPLPSKCKDIHLHLIHKNNATVDCKLLKCCKELQIFEDIRNLNLESEQSKPTNDSTSNLQEKTTPGWWEVETVVRGFKDEAIKGCDIWS